MTLIAMLALPFLAWPMIRLGQRLRNAATSSQIYMAEVAHKVNESVGGIRVVKAFAQEQREAERFRAANRHNLAVNDRLNKTWSLFSPTVSVLTEVGLLVVWAFGIWLVAGGWTMLSWVE